jgi:dTDP-glucose 4,6-dehydratase
MEKAIITGATGFYGHHLVKYILANTDWNIIAMGRENFAGNLNRIYELEEYRANKDRVRIVWHDLRSSVNNTVLKQITNGSKINYIFHVAASSHVTRSIKDPMSFVYDNVVGTANLLEMARQIDGLKKLLYFSTDEVFGASKDTDHKFEPWDRYKAGNPYSATKAGGEELCVAYENTYALPIVITHCMNIIGERQHPEKYLPKIIKHVLEGKTLTVHTDEKGKIPTKRHYIYADEVSNAILTLVKKGKIGEKYNIEGQQELDNLEFANYVAEKLGAKLDYKLIPGIEDRPGHDFKYSLDNSAIKALGYREKHDFWKELDKTILWYKENNQWLLG